MRAARRGARGLAAVTLGAAIVAMPASAYGPSSSAAAPAAGSGFGSFTFSSQAEGVEVIEDNAAAPIHPEGDVQIPLATTSLQGGPIGYALGSIAWPGGEAANFGTLLGVLGVPSSVPTGALNDPIRAEAHNGDGRVVNTKYPNVTMTADVQPARTTASADLKSLTAAGVVSIGATRSSGSSSLTGPAVGISTGSERVAKISLANGAITVGSVVSRATARSDAKHATAHGAVTVSGVKVAGVPVTVTKSGISVSSHALGVVAGPASALVDTTLQKLGITLRLATPTRKGKRGHVTYSTGSLLVHLTTPHLIGTGSPSSFYTALHIGEVTVTADATRGTPYRNPPPTSPPTSPASNPPPVGSGSSGTAGGITGTDLPPVQTSTGGGGAGSPPSVAGPQTHPVSASLPPLTGALSPWWLVVGLIAATLIGVGVLRRFPTALAATSARCPREEA